MSEFTRAEVCAVAIAETFRGDGEILVSPIGNLPQIGARLAKLTFAAYLIHPAVLDVLLKATPGNTRVVFSEIWWYVTFLGVSCVVLIFSFLGDWLGEVFVEPTEDGFTIGRPHIEG